jgi:acetylornithine deacetylase/succinyl-diaminopimelate desuccinylase-like protein
MDPVANAVCDRIDGSADELVDLALELANINAPVGSEALVAEHIHGWYQGRGIDSQLVELTPGRSNVVGRLRGAGDGQSLLFNAHLDTEAGGADFANLMQVPNPNDIGAWRDGDRLFGHTLLNDRHAHALFMVAAAAIASSDVRLAGDLVLTSVAGETGQAPVDEYRGLGYEGKGFGTSYLLQHGVTADYAIVAETSGFAPCWIHCGAIYYKVTVRGRNMYTPRFRRSGTLADHPNAIVKAAEVVRAIESWATTYTAERTVETACGTMAPNALPGAIRGGIPWRPNRSSPYCAVYVDVRTVPGQDPDEITRSLRDAIAATGIDADVEPYLHRPGAIGEGVEPLLASLRGAHRDVRGNDPPDRAESVVVSMWRDTNLLNLAGIPAVNFGPSRGRAAVQGTGFMTVDDLVDAAKMYALTALDVCGTV